MKKVLSIALVLVLTAALFTGCGCTAKDAKYTTAPTTMPTIATMPTTEATRATTEATTEATIDRGNGPLEDTTMDTLPATESGTTEETAEGRSRSMAPKGR